MVAPIYGSEDFAHNLLCRFTPVPLAASLYQIKRLRWSFFTCLISLFQTLIHIGFFLTYLKESQKVILSHYYEPIYK